MTQVHQCIDRCHTPLAKAQGLVTSELQSFQVSVIHQHPCASWPHAAAPLASSRSQCGIKEEV